MKLKFKQIMKEKKVQLLTLAAGAHLLLNYLRWGQLDILSYLIYLGLAVAIGYVASTNKKIKLTNCFFVGASLPIIYNGLGTMIGLFSVSITFIIMSALQQGALAFIIAKMRGIK